MLDGSNDKLFGILVPQGAIIVNYVGWWLGVLSFELAFMSMFVLVTCIISHIAVNTSNSPDVVGITASDDDIEYKRL